MEVVVGAPFAGSGRWAEAEIEKREARGERGLVRLAYTELYTALVPGDQSAYRDAEVSDSGAPRLAGYVLAIAVREAAERELSGYVVVDSPRRAIQTLQATGADSIIEVTVSQATAIKRADEHLELLQEIVPRVSAGDRADADQQCKKMIDAYFRERSVLETVNVRQVRAPTTPPLRAITHAYKAAAGARRRGNTEGVKKWLTAARDWSKAHGLPTEGIRVPA